MAEESLNNDTAMDAEDTATGASDTGPDVEGATPPGYDDWPTHGGYLGCLIAVMFACLLAPLGYIGVGFLGAFLAPALGSVRVGVGVSIAIVALVYIAAFIGLSRLGWRMGKRYLRDYPEARMLQTEAEPAVDTAASTSDDGI